ncbi:SDR family NAD(P)-dependent oxidoreductase [Nocardia bhagyanarayanae]|uniref:Thioester reductase-like protein n=1 Tax=Nocardia bhagyanarayanae TaxID=1215925 RepID=A0A543FI94_9NOCA|nr:SDR family NAD(P)-dependent oxidoreductase [Nocardia bhagyanarayanae]TQM33569.1 thioester reductase-like protein [Nocardia bhagyanarayanae]
MSGIELNSFATTVLADDPVVRDHRVHGVRILPGVVYLDMIMRAAMAAGHAPADLVIREAFFHRPVALDTGGAVRIAFRVEASSGRVRIDVQRLDSGVPTGPIELIAECVVAHPDSFSDPEPAEPGALRAALVAARGLDEMYRQSGSRGIEHRDFMRAAGIFGRHEDVVTAELTLGAEGAASLPGFLLHPTFLDASTIVPFVDPRRLGIDDDSAFIPIHFSEVRAWRPTPERVFVRAAVRGHAQDLLRADVQLYDDAGRAIAEYRLTSKRVRGSADIHRLLTESDAAQPTATMSPVAASTGPIGPASAHTESAPSHRADTRDPLAVITADLAALVAAEMAVDSTGIATDVGFYELGLDSSRLLRLTSELEARVGEPLYPTLLFEYQTIDALAGHLADTVGSRYRAATTEPVAVQPTEPHRDSLITFGFEWQPADSPHPRREPGSLLVFDTADRPYRHRGRATVIRVRPGDEFVSGTSEFVVDPADPQHLRSLLTELSTRRLSFDAAVYLWGERLAGAEIDPHRITEQVYLPLRELVRAMADAPDAPVHRVLALSAASTPGTLSSALIGGFARTVQLELPRPIVRAVLCDKAADFDAVIATELAIDHDSATEIRYRAGRREVRTPREFSVAATGTTAPQLEQRLVAMVTGGFGGIGKQLARRLAREYRARLVLVSRGPLDESGARLLAEIAGLGGEAVHVRADISDAADVERAVAIARATFGRIDAVYHGAGELRDGLVASTPGEAARSVLAPKLCGAEWLIRAVPEARLMMLFSSVSAVLGNPGQADYAAANRYLDAFAELRDHTAGSPRVISINWPLWAEGGMRPPTEQIEALRRAGIGLLPTDIGLDLLMSSASADRAQVACIWGDADTVRARLRTDPTTPAARPTEIPSGNSGTPADPVPQSSRAEDETTLAIVGFSGRYPDADTLDEFWRNLRDGHDAVGPVPAQRWWLTAAEHSAGAPPMTGGFLRDVAGFDPQFFRIPPAHAPLMDPQERLFLQQAYAALEHAGYHHEDPAVRDRRVGVFVGATWSDYRLLGVEATRHGDPVAVASIPSSIANRTSYSLGLRGPSLTVDTACSASLTALHLARRSLLDGECDAAIVGGVNLLLHQDKFLLLSSLGMVSDTGRCRPFGAGADGYVPGEGVGAVYLKPLRTALADGDTIHGLVLGSAVNHGGQTAGYSVPHPGAQAEVISEALRAAGVEPGTIGYLEAHGTGTALGDPIEIAGLATVFGQPGGEGRQRALGSTKSNIGHLEAAAGIAGLTRVLLQFRHGRIAPTLHAAQLNPAVAFDTVPFHLPQQLEDWPRATVDGIAAPRRAGISAFGAGGANAHVVLSEFIDQRARPAATGEPEVFVLSARSAGQLRRYAETMARHFRALDPADFADAVRTLQVGRPALGYRLAVVATSPHAVATALEQYLGDQASPVVTGALGASTRSAELGSATSPEQVARQWVAGAAIDWTEPARRIPLPGYPFEQRDYWIIAPPKSGFAAAVARFESTPRQGGIVEPGQTELGRYAAMRLFGVLADLGLTTGEWSVESVLGRIGALPSFRRLLTSCLDILLRHGLVRGEGDAIVVTGPPPGTTWMRADLLARFPQTEPYVTLVDACLAAYPRVLRGELAATEVLFPRGELDLVGAIYRGNAAYDFANGLLADLVAALAQERTGNAAPLRVVEVGAGTGGSTHAVVSALVASGASFEYHYTDVSQSFVAHGRRTFPDRAEMRFGVLDIEADPVTQGFPVESADLVVCANVLHAVRAIGPALHHVRRLLAPSGVLAFTEATTDLEVLALTFGLLDGWHGYRDPELRIAHSPLLSEDQWRVALANAGYTGVRAWGPGLSADTEPSFRLLAGVSDSVPALVAELPQQDAVGIATPSTSPDHVDAVDISRLEAEVTGMVAEGLGVSGAEVHPGLPLSEYGVDSILAVKIIDRVNARYGLSLRPTVVFDHPSVRQLSRRIADEGAIPAAAPTDAPSAAISAPGTTTPAATAASVRPAIAPSIPSERTATQSMDIAVIGMSGRFPGAANLDEFWRNLAEGRDAVTEVPPSRWPIADHFRPGPVTPGRTYSKWGGFLDDIDRFDPTFFDMVPAEADYMDPQQRLFLEHSWLALEDAAIDPKSLRRSRCGVFAGSPGSDYATLLRDRAGFGSHHMFTGNSPAILPARVAYHLDLTGPCLGLDTACSSALVAVHQACRSLATGESDLALAGGVAVFVTPEYHLLASSMGMLSPHGRCASFDAAADGFVIAEGVGVVVLKPLAAAERDGDPIRGVIRGIGVNHDGRTNGITAPSTRSQAELELDVYRTNGIDPSSIGYIETHGTGTRLGDPIEVSALTSAFRRYTDTVGTIPIGSVKSNIGHASHAAGMASLFKVLLAMRAGQIPPSLHVESVNPLLDLANSPFFVNTDLRAWPEGPRRAAVSSFGFSGTNAHLVVDDYPSVRAPHRSTGSDGPQVVVLSARTAGSLGRAARALRRHLAAHPEVMLPDIARTFAFGRAHFEHRLAIVADSVDGLAARLADFVEGDTPASVVTGLVHDTAVPEPSATVLADPIETARRWVAGERVEFTGWSAGFAQRVHLPGYQFERERCWVPEGTAPEIAAEATTVAEPVLRPTPAPRSAPVAEAGSSRSADETPLGQIAEEYLKGLLAAYCRLDADRIRTRIPLQDYGIDSVLISRMNDRLETDFGALPSTLFFEYQTVRDLAGYLAEEHPERLVALHTEATRPSTPDAPASATAPANPTPTVAVDSPAARPAPDRDDDIAVIGMAGRFPMAQDIEEFWANLVSGRDCIIEVPPDRWDHRALHSDDPDEPGTTYARWGGFIDDVDKFDARFFGITPKDAEEMDPQQRLFLETSWAALEDAGYTPDRVRAGARARGLVDAGVFAGVGYAEYQAFVGVPISGYFAIPNRVSYHLGFSGPSLAVDTACSASLTALHLACESLRRGESAYALAGGVNVSIHPGKYLLLGYGRWASTDGRCRSFGAGGDGYVPGEGVVTLVLKPLRHARADGDRVYGVIRGSAVNHGGRTNGFTVPNPTAQADLIGRALTTAGVDARDIGYVEAHGTGTALGDPIEIAALTRAYRRSTAERGYCGIGSAKSSVGHLEAAAGAAGVVKALLQLRHDTMAPNLHSDPSNPAIDFGATPFRIIDTPTAWPRPDDGTPRITAVSSFGAGGSNAHVILADAGQLPPSEADDQPRLVMLSARDADRLTEAVGRLARQLRENPLPLADVAWTLAVGRVSFEHRLAVVATSTAQLVELLESAADPAARVPAAGLLVFRGVARTHRELDELPGESEADRTEMRGLLRSGNLPRAAELWAGGWTVEWERVYERPFGRIVSLPTYAFARRRHWIVPEDYRRRTESTARDSSQVDRNDTGTSQLVAKTVVAQSPQLTGSGPRNGHRSNGATAQSISEGGEANTTETGDGDGAMVAAFPIAAEPEPAAPAESDDELRALLREQIRDIFADLTKTDPAELELDADFVDFGFDSVATVRMLNRLMKLHEVKIPAESIELYPTISSLADYLVAEGIIAAATPSIGAPQGTADARAVDVQDDIPVVTMEAPIAVESVFITGVTGVLGGKVLHDLLAHTDVRVTCLVRGTSLAGAEKRIKHFLATYDPEGALDAAFAARVTPLLGDVSKDRFGLDETTWHRIAQEVDLTIHAAGRTTLVTFYDALAPINVEGTRRAIDFALQSRGRYLVYVSSFSALGDRLNFNNPPFTERDLELGQGYDHLPYQQTKYESEKLIRAASERGLLWDIVRPGNIMGDSVTGRYPFSEVSVKGAYYDILKTMIESGETMLTPVYWDISPVDYVSAAIVHIGLRRPTYRETYHLTNPDIRRYYDVVRNVQQAGYQVDLVPLEEFHRRVTEREIYRRGTDEVYDSQTLEMFKYGIELFGYIHYEESSYADCAYTRRVLGAAGIDCPPIEQLVQVYLAHCAEVGYIPAPKAAESTVEAAR